MAREKPPVFKLHELNTAHPSADFFALLSEKQPIANRGNAFYKCKFKDRKRTVSCAIWSDHPLFLDCEKAWKVNSFYKIRGHYIEHEKYGPCIEIHAIREINEDDRQDGFRESDFILTTRFDSNLLYKELLELVESELENQQLKELIRTLLAQFEDAIKIYPASGRTYYPFSGGWLEHTLNVMKNCMWLSQQYAERYPDLNPFNRDLILAGAVLHDIGRLRELASTATSIPETTIEGHVLGHQILGRDLVRDAARSIAEFDPELLLLLDHMIISHLVKPEWGSLRLPVIPEVLILHYADDLDAKFEMYSRLLINDMKEGPFTESDPVLKKPLLKNRSQ